MREIIIEKANKNIGSLCLFLKSEKNLDYLIFLNNNIPKDITDRNLSEKVYYFVNNIDNLLKCECGKHLSFIGFKNGYRNSCGDKHCSNRNRKNTCIKKYGVDNPKKSKDIIKKEQENILKRWNGSHYMNDYKIKDKFKETMLNRYGVEWSQQSNYISNKSKITWDSNPDKETIIRNRSNTLKNKSEDEKNSINKKKVKTINKNWGSVSNLYKHINDKIRQKSIDNYGIEHHLSHPDIINKRIDKYRETITNKIKSKLPSTIVYLDRLSNVNNSDNIIKLKCLKCETDFDINRQFLVNRQKINTDICIMCNPISNGVSEMELQLLSLIRENYKGEIITSDKEILNGREIDIYLPELKLGFEFNGLYWHSEKYKDKNYHKNKTNDCLELGIQLVHIWEDDWLYKNDIIKSIILNKLNISDRIWARKCEIREVNNSDVRIFLNENHIQGFVGSKSKIGLYFNNELVSLMTFGSLRRSLGYKKEENTYELLRFCNKIGKSVVGGASKLFKHFLKNNDVNSIISYSDNSRGIGNLYEKLGFEFKHNTESNYYYIVDGCRVHRFNYRKDKLISDGYDKSKTELQIMNDRGINRVFDCGSKKWQFIKK